MNTVLYALNPEEQKNVLLAVANSVLPNPGIGYATRPSDISKDLKNEVLTEIRSLLELNPTDYSISAYSRIYQFLTAEMRRHVLVPSQIPSVKKRLGHKGGGSHCLWKPAW